MRKVLQCINNCKIGKNTVVNNFTNLYDCTIGENCLIGPFVEIQKNAVIGDRVKVESHSFICEGITIEDEVFISHHVVFINDKFPRSTNATGKLQIDGEWKLLKTIVKKGASIGSNATVLGGIVIGENAVVGAGAVVTKDVEANMIVVGNPAKVVRKITKV